MTLKEILAISGQSGLFKLVASSRSSLIVENLETGKRLSVSTTTKVSSLHDISVFTVEGDMPLAQILLAFREKHNAQTSIDHKSDAAAIKSLFSEIVPEYDTDRVYVSDMKKIINWYNTLQANNMLEILDQEIDSEDTTTVEE